MTSAGAARPHRAAPPRLLIATTNPGKLREIAAILDQVAEADPDFEGSSLVTLVRQPFEVAESEPIVTLVREQARKVTGRNPELVGWAGWMDSALLSAAGIPTVVYGPGGEGSHATVEWARLDHLDILRDVLIATAREFCG